MNAQRNYCFTAFIEPDIENKEDIKYMIYQKEKCPETGKIHYQGYIELKKTMRFEGVKKIFNDHTIHLEQRKGTREQAIKYCEKNETQEGKPIEYGDRNIKQGTRTELKAITDQIEEGKKIKEIAQSDPATYIKFYKGINEYKNLITEHNEERKIKVYVLIGPAGCGKTTLAYKLAKRKNEEIYKLDTNTNGTLWFNGYNDEKFLLIDDFYGWIRYSQLLTLLDKWPCRLEIKGGHTYAKWEYVIITSNNEVKTWYPNILNIKALERRIRKTRNYYYEGVTRDEVTG